MNNPNIREVVLDILLEVIEKESYSHLVLQAALSKYQYLDKQQRSFISRVSQGTLEHLIEIDYIINAYSKTPVRKMKPLIRNILRMSVYQLKYMDSIPDSAVCNEAVKLASKRGLYQLKGFVNGVLRNIARNINEITFSDIATQYSIPQWLFEMWEGQYGKEATTEMLIAFQSNNTTCIRTNLSRITEEELKVRLEEEGVSVHEIPTLPYAFYIEGYDYLMALKAFQQGLFYVQDMSSMMVAERADIQSGDYCIDVCAAPGGKSLHVAELLQGTGMVEARDVSDYKVSLIQENIIKSGLNNIKAVKMDATILDEDSIEKADVVIADLPCSGLGVIGRKPDIKLHMTPEKLQNLAKLQAQMLDIVCQYVKPQGTLVFSTCTINRGENEDNVEQFVKQHPEFTVVSMEQMLPKQGMNDGFFTAVMHKE